MHRDITMKALQRAVNAAGREFPEGESLDTWRYLASSLLRAPPCSCDAAPRFARAIFA